MSARIERTGLACLLALAMMGCRPEPSPKPRGYFRIDLPAQEYTAWNVEAPFAAEVPVYAKVRPNRQEPNVRWYDLVFPYQRATVHLTWSRVGNDLDQLIEDAHTFKDKHGAKAARIRSERLLRPEDRVFGNLFEVDGDAASPMVFYLTDSTDHFLYGALYFNSRPNADSLAPVTDRIRQDIRHMVGTLQWRSL